jgi:hypothetical protein
LFYPPHTPKLPTINMPLELEEAHIASIKEWITTCNKQHAGKCAPRNAGFCPSWLIDTHLECVVQGKGDTSYFALSYVWPETKTAIQDKTLSILKLQVDNLSAISTPGYLSPLNCPGHVPNVIRDAMELTTELGQRFLWVDRLCLVQDAETTATEVSRMVDIYSNAHLTFIAAASSGLTSAGTSSLQRTKYFLSSRGRDVPVWSCYDRLWQTKWATRGWTYQEHIFSSRTIVFLDGDFFWDCKCSIWDETVSDGSATFHHKVPDHVQRWNDLSSCWWPDFRLYLELTALYSNREFTYVNDVAPAYAGILGYLEPSFLGGFVAGMPKLFLDHVLLWQPFNKARRRLSPVAWSRGPSKMKQLPSWSWMGWQCYIDPWSLRTGLSWSTESDCCYNICRSWRTNNLIEWSIVDADTLELYRATEPILLQQYGPPASNADGWTRQIASPPAQYPKLDVYFANSKDPDERFTSPLPLQSLIQKQTPPAISKTYYFLSGETTTATLRVRMILDTKETIPPPGVGAAPKLSVFEHPAFEIPEEIPSVLVLEDNEEVFAGTLRLMGDEDAPPHAEIELIAISTGSVDQGDLYWCFEEKVSLEHEFFWRKSRRTTLFGPRMALEHCRPVRRVKAESGDEKYEFYNVLWVDRKDGITYRHACGRVPKDVWEKHARPRNRVILG